MSRSLKKMPAHEVLVSRLRAALVNLKGSPSGSQQEATHLAVIDELISVLYQMVVPKESSSLVAQEVHQLGMDCERTSVTLALFSLAAEINTPGSEKPSASLFEKPPEAIGKKKPIPVLVFTDTPPSGDGDYHCTACFTELGVHVPFVMEAHSENNRTKSVGEAAICDGSCHFHRVTPMDFSKEPHHSDYDRRPIVAAAVAFHESRA